MSALIISCENSTKHQELSTFVKQYQHIKLTDTSFVIRSEESPEEISTTLIGKTGSNCRVFIASLNKIWSSWLPPQILVGFSEEG